MSDTDTMVPTRWTYCGRRMTSKGRLASAWQRDGAENESWFSGKTVAGAVIGGVYEILSEVKDDGSSSVRFSSASFVEKIDDDVELARLRLEDRAAYGENEAAALQRKLAKDNGDLSDLTLGDLRKMMNKAMPARRTAMATTVLNFLGGM